MPAGSLLNRPPVFSVWLQTVENALLPPQPFLESHLKLPMVIPERAGIRCFGTKLEPRYIVGTGPLDQ
jgi:hypothetical protein